MGSFLLAQQGLETDIAGGKYNYLLGPQIFGKLPQLDFKSIYFKPLFHIF